MLPCPKLGSDAVPSLADKCHLLRQAVRDYVVLLVQCYTNSHSQLEPDIEALTLFTFTFYGHLVKISEVALKRTKYLWHCDL